jgi:hypothetical protein
MNAKELRALVEQHGNEPKFFSPNNMRMFGDTMSNFGVRSATITVEYDAQGEYMGGKTEVIEVWELYRKRPVSGGIARSHYFDKVVFSERSPVREHKQ